MATVTEATEAASASASAPAEPEALVDDDVLYEVIDGRIVEKVMGTYSTRLASVLQEYLGPFAREHRLGVVVTEMIFRIDPARNLQRRPDVAFVSARRWPLGRRLPEKSPWDLVPDLAIEVVSPSSTASQIKKKLRDYFRAGVIAVWVVYPETEEVEVYESPTSVRILARDQNAELDGDPLLPGCRLPLATLFEGEAE